MHKESFILKLYICVTQKLEPSRHKEDIIHFIQMQLNDCTTDGERLSSGRLIKNARVEFVKVKLKIKPSESLIFIIVTSKRNIYPDAIFFFHRPDAGKV